MIFIMPPNNTNRFLNNGLCQKRLDAAVIIITPSIKYTQRYITCFLLCFSFLSGMGNCRVIIFNAQEREILNRIYEFSGQIAVSV